MRGLWSLNLFFAYFFADWRKPPPFPHRENRVVKGLFGDQAGDDSSQKKLIRITAGCIALWTAGLFMGKLGETFKGFTDRKFMGFTTGATVIGPVLGIWSAMFALSKAPIGIASTLMSLSPLFMIPLSWKVFGEKTTLRTVVGTVIALVGVAGLFLF